MLSSAHPEIQIMQLHGSYTSPYVRHIRIVLAQTGLACEFVETDYAASAAQSPACRVPFLVDGELQLTDSVSILKYLREKAGQSFFPEVAEFDSFLLVNTAMDSSVNLFLLEKDGVTPETSAYLARQQRRVAQTLGELERRLAAGGMDPAGDAGIRLGCFLSWALFRERLTLADHPALADF
ncbi:MAG: glutathione S-transferase family protein, partial [Wenzhouxiangellaceae bacterium]